jgi:hypothetical protein
VSSGECKQNRKSHIPFTIIFGTHHVCFIKIPSYSSQLQSSHHPSITPPLQHLPLRCRPTPNIITRALNSTRLTLRSKVIVHQIQSILDQIDSILKLSREHMLEWRKYIMTLCNEKNMPKHWLAHQIMTSSRILGFWSANGWMMRSLMGDFLMLLELPIFEFCSFVSAGRRLINQHYMGGKSFIRLQAW